MKDVLYAIFGQDRHLTIIQMSARALMVYFICLLLIRISGRRSFGLKTPFDTVITIILGALISRVIVGVSPFWPTIAASLCIVVLHRLLAIVRLRFPDESFLNGKPLLLYTAGTFVEANLRKAMLTQGDILATLRKDLHQEDLEGILKIYMEKTGEISFVRHA